MKLNRLFESIIFYIFLSVRKVNNYFIIYYLKYVFDIISSEACICIALIKKKLHPHKCPLPIVKLPNFLRPSPLTDAYFSLI